jgi:hypothetical protein
MALSTKELISQIPKEPDIRNSRYVSIVNRREKSLQEYQFITVTTIPGQKPRKHKQTIIDLSKKGMRDSSAIWVQCDCERFKFTWEYALAKVGASRIFYSNGEPPVSTNPRLYPACCKHLYFCLNDLLKKKGGISRNPY